MDKKDEIILQQLDVIRTMSENNLKRMTSDFWGAPTISGSAKKDAGAAKKGTPPTATSGGEAPKSAEEPEVAPLSYLPFLLLVSLFTGALSGFIASLLFRAMANTTLMKE